MNIPTRPEVFISATSGDLRSCRQMIKELGPNAEVLFLGAAGEIIHAAIDELLPHSFQLETL